MFPIHLLQTREVVFRTWRNIEFLSIRSHASDRRWRLLWAAMEDANNKLCNFIQTHMKYQLSGSVGWFWLFKDRLSLFLFLSLSLSLSLYHSLSLFLSTTHTHTHICIYIYIYTLTQSKTFWTATWWKNDNYCLITIVHIMVRALFTSKFALSISFWCIKCCTYGKRERFEWVW